MMGEFHSGDVYELYLLSSGFISTRLKGSAKHPSTEQE